MAINDIVQTIAEARVDARSLSEFVFKPAGFKVARRLAPTVDTLQFYIDRFDATKATTDAYVATIPNIVNDAINNTAVEGGVLADTFVTATAQSPTRVARNQRDKNSDIVSVKDFGAKGGGVANDADKVQKNIAWVEDKKIPYIFFPTNEDNYRLETPLIFTQPGLRIYGNKGVSYNRGTGKHGYLLVAPTASHALDLGANREYVGGANPADCWTVENIGIKQASDVVGRTKDGIRFTAKTDGPDRGGKISGLSCVGLFRAIYIPDPGKSTAYATMTIENCCLSNNSYALFAEGKVDGLRFVGNQAEQNVLGAIHGTFSARVHIADNMLEGQRDCINITIPPITGNRPKIVVKGNYFEAMSGDYVMQFAGNSSDMSIELQDNMTLVHPAGTDYVRIVGSGAWNLINRDRFPVTFLGNAVLKPSSDFINNETKYYQVRQLSSGGSGITAIFPRYHELAEADSTYAVDNYTKGTKVNTPFGTRYTVDGNGFAAVSQPVAVGDLVSINMLVKLSGVETTKDMILQVYNRAGTVVVSENPISITPYIDGQWVVLHHSFRANIASDISIGVRLYSATNTTRHILSIASKNHGNYVNDGTQVNKVYPVCPPLRFTPKITATIPEQTLAAGSQVSRFADFVGVRAGDVLQVSYDKTLGGTRIWAEYRLDDKIIIYQSNGSTAPITVAAGTVTVSIIN